MHLLALDIGTRHTGVAFYDRSVGIVMPLDTIHHASVDALLDAVTVIVKNRSVDHVYVGLPLLPSGEEGTQAQAIRSILQRLREASISASTVDERYSTPMYAIGDGDAEAACSLLKTVVEKVVDK